MKTKVTAILVGMMVFMSLALTQAAIAEDGVDLEAYYSGVIDKLIAKCKYKTDMRYSKSKAIRDAAMLSCLKTTFYKQNKERLIQAMIQADIGLKRYKVNYFLNSKFYKIVRPSGVQITHARLFD